MTILQDPLVSLTISLAFALLFALSAMHKLRSVSRFEAVLDSYRLVPQSILAVVAMVVPIMELALAIGLLIPQLRIAAALAASSLLLAYAIAMAVNILRGNVLLDCGCSFGSARQGVSWGLVWRNLLLSVLPLQLLIIPVDRLINGYDLVATVFAVAVAGLFYATANTLIHQQQFTRRLKPRWKL